MLLVIACLALAQCGILLLLLFVGKKLDRQHIKETKVVCQVPGEQWPRIAMIVPVGGNSPQMLPALTSLLTQDYPDYLPVFVTKTPDEVAAQTIRGLQKEFPSLRHVVAGEAVSCGQKNHNTLQGIASIADAAVDVYVFCDSTHMATPDFLRCLVYPLVGGQREFSTGYHSVEHSDEQWVTVAYSASVLLMRLLQGVSRFTQPWGGAMAIRRTAFEREGIARLWSETVVDDCSLASMLLRRRIPVQLCASALLNTIARGHSLSVWRAWMERQILFLKFCIPFQWKLLGILVLCMFVPPAFAALAFLGGLLGVGTGSAVAISLCWLAVFWSEMSYMRRLLAKPCSQWRFAGAFLLACGMFTWVYLGTLRAKSILWQGKNYNVGPDGRVL